MSPRRRRHWPAASVALVALVAAIVSIAPADALASWSIVPSPNNGTNDNDLLGVSCASARSCKAVGFYTNEIGVNQTLIESWNGISWSVVPSPDNGTAYNVLIGVSCRRAGKSCTAVGDYYNTSLRTYRSLIESNG